MTLIQSFRKPLLTSLRLRPQTRLTRSNLLVACVNFREFPKSDRWLHAYHTSSSKLQDNHLQSSHSTFQATPEHAKTVVLDKKGSATIEPAPEPDNLKQDVNASPDHGGVGRNSTIDRYYPEHSVKTLSKNHDDEPPDIRRLREIADWMEPSREKRIGTIDIFPFPFFRTSPPRLDPRDLALYTELLNKSAGTRMVILLLCLAVMTFVEAMDREKENGRWDIIWSAETWERLVLAIKGWGKTEPNMLEYDNKDAEGALSAPDHSIGKYVFGTVGEGVPGTPRPERIWCDSRLAGIFVVAMAFKHLVGHLRYTRPRRFHRIAKVAAIVTLYMMSKDVFFGPHLQPRHHRQGPASKLEKEWKSEVVQERAIDKEKVRVDNSEGRRLSTLSLAILYGLVLLWV
ncbi:hypothetical protein EJ08DRAFT_662251 [Tothia fuscella]|uniref:Uncharacterized protein n=1 Tax=Tothia fuscella TaxID=1048955 RepID=A0A9P4NPB0_9PEZI|nr:hypothetical protein EJ08DRAFT_662251 [Tothia fuscella]